MAKEIKEGIFWIGVKNPDGRDFHGISTPKGGSYNSFLIQDDMPVIIDSTNKGFLEEYMGSLRQVIDPALVRYIIVNHAEPDHAGALKEVLLQMPDAKIVCTEKCREFLLAAFGIDAKFLIVGDGDTLQIGRKSLRFYTDPMVHWPETMMSYLVEDKVLFSADLFGTEISHDGQYSDELGDFTLQTRDYFALILRPFALAVKRAIAKIKDLDIDLLAPSHGPVYRDPKEIIEYSQRLAENPEDDKVLILYYSIWDSTEKMAFEIAKGISEQGMEVKVIDISKTNHVTIMAEALTSKAIVVGSLTIIGSFHPLYEAIFPLLKLNNQPDKVCAVFGTYGWASVAVGKLKERLSGLGYDIVDEIDLRFGPKEKDYERLRELGKNVTDAIRIGKD